MLPNIHNNILYMVSSHTGKTGITTIVSFFHSHSIQHISSWSDESSIQSYQIGTFSEELQSSMCVEPWTSRNYVKLQKKTTTTSKNFHEMLSNKHHFINYQCIWITCVLFQSMPMENSFINIYFSFLCHLEDSFSLLCNCYDGNKILW